MSARTIVPTSLAASNRRRENSSTRLSHRRERRIRRGRRSVSRDFLDETHCQTGSRCEQDCQVRRDHRFLRSPSTPAISGRGPNNGAWGSIRSPIPWSSPGANSSLSRAWLLARRVADAVAALAGAGQIGSRAIHFSRMAIHLERLSALAPDARFRGNTVKTTNWPNPACALSRNTRNNFRHIHIAFPMRIK